MRTDAVWYSSYFLLTCSQIANYFHLDDGSGMFLRNVGSYNSNAASHLRKITFLIVATVNTSNLT
jgi:hypothetical protein